MANLQLDIPRATIVLAGLVMFLIGCESNSPAEPQSQEHRAVEDPYAHITDDSARLIIRAAVEEAGGLERWRSISRLQYDKDFALLNSDGSVEKTYRQRHDYDYDAPLISIESIENGDTLLTTRSDKEIKRRINGEAAEVTATALVKSLNTSLYVVGIPFKLLDPGVALRYLGLDTLFDGRVGQVIEARYDAEANDNHSTSDVWRYYFGIDRPMVLANWVDAGDHYSLIDNETFVVAGDISWPEKRKSYRIDSTGSVLYLRADYQYDNYIVEF